MDTQYWLDLAADYLTAYRQAFPSATPHRNALIIAMSVAEHETNNGRAWPGTNNFGAVQLRSCTADELAAIQAGTLKAGDYTPTRDGVLHIDTHPTKGGSLPYPVWFAAFPTRVAGVAHFLRTLWHLSLAAPDSPDSTCALVALKMYMHGYYEGAHAGARPTYQRVPPLTLPEQANVDDYAGAAERCRSVIEPALEGWSFDRDANVQTSDAVAPAVQ